MPPLNSEGYCAPTSALRPAISIFQAAMASIRLSSSVVCSRRGRPTFSSTVSEPNNPPCWNITPQRRRSANASCSLSAPSSWPNTRITPASGRCNMIISRSSVDLPEPLPPMTATISLRCTARSMHWCTTWDPKRVATPRSSSTVSVMLVAAAMSQIQHAEGNREQGIGHDHQENALHHAACGLAPHTVGAAPGAQTLKASHHGDDGCKHRCLANSHQ